MGKGILAPGVNASTSSSKKQPHVFSESKHDGNDHGKRKRKETVKNMSLK